MAGILAEYHPGMRACRLFLAVFLSAAPLAFAQGLICHTNAPAPAPAEGPAPRLSGIGAAHLQIATDVKDAQAFFDQGLALLHGFNDFEALRSFRQAARLDPAAPMPQWGIAQALKNDPSVPERKAALAKAKENAFRASEREQYFIRAAVLLDEDDGGDGKAAYRREMEALLDRFPDEIEGRLLFALSLLDGYDPEGRPRGGQAYGQTLLRELVRTHPEHMAAHHYFIHAVENGPRPEEAIASAEALPRLAPKAGHLVHMPGHVWFRTGDYERARAAFLAGKAADEDYERTAGVTPAEDWNYGHNLGYLAAACAEAGRADEALSWARALRDVSETQPFRATEESAPFEVAARSRDWAAMKVDARRPAPDAERTAYRRGALLFAEGMEALDARRTKDAAARSEALDAHLGRLVTSVGSPEGLRDDLTALALELRGRLALARGETADGVALLERVAKPPSVSDTGEAALFRRPRVESLGWGLLAAGDRPGAAAAFERSLAFRRGNAPAGGGLEKARAGK